MRQPTIIRSRQEIIQEILASLEKSDLPRTKVMYRASLSYTQLKYYEEYLKFNGLISQAEDDDSWVLTEKGKRYLEVCRLAAEILRAPSHHGQELITSESSRVL